MTNCELAIMILRSAFVGMLDRAILYPSISSEYITVCKIRKAFPIEVPLFLRTIPYTIIPLSERNK